MEKEFTDLLYQHQGIIHKVSRLYFNNRVEYDDYKQELVIQLWKAFPKYNGDSKYSTWMYRVCFNAAIDLLRKEKLQPDFAKFDNEQISSIPEVKSELSENQEKLYMAISELSDVDKAIITLYLDEYSYKEIADMIGISESNTGVKINRIKSQILKQLQNGNR